MILMRLLKAMTLLVLRREQMSQPQMQLRLQQPPKALPPASTAPLRLTLGQQLPRMSMPLLPLPLLLPPALTTSSISSQVVGRRHQQTSPPPRQLTPSRTTGMALWAALPPAPQPTNFNPVGKSRQYNQQIAAPPPLRQLPQTACQTGRRLSNH